MLHQLIATICGVTLYTHVNACRVTLQQATLEYNTMIDAKVTHYRHQLEASEYAKPFQNIYMASFATVGRILYNNQVTLNEDNLTLTLNRQGVTCLLRLTF